MRLDDCYKNSVQYEQLNIDAMNGKSRMIWLSTERKQLAEMFLLITI